jgi:hypothetical protein
MPWAEPIFDEIAMVSAMRCHVCNKIERKEKIMVAKWDLLKNMQVKQKVQMVSGSWIQNVCM